MRTLNTLRNATMATLAIAAFNLPTLAQAKTSNGNYHGQNNECKSKENDAQLIGGLLGAAIGGIAGSEIAGRGDHTEGAIIGVVLGGLAGAAIGDESVDCDKRRRRVYTTGYRDNGYRNSTYRNNRGYNNGRNNGYQTSGYRTVTYPSRNRGYNRDRGYNRGNNNGHNVSYGTRGYDNAYERHDHYERIEKYNRTYAQLEDVRYRVQKLHKKEYMLERKIRYADDAYRRHDLQERLGKIRYESKRLRKKERRLERRLRDLKRPSY